MISGDVGKSGTNARGIMTLHGSPADATARQGRRRLYLHGRRLIIIDPWLIFLPASHQFLLPRLPPRIPIPIPIPRVLTRNKGLFSLIYAYRINLPLYAQFRARLRLVISTCTWATVSHPDNETLNYPEQIFFFVTICTIAIPFILSENHLW